MQDLGMLSINTNKLDQIIRPSPSSCVKLLHQMLPRMYTDKNESLLASLTTCNEQVSVNPTLVSEFTQLTMDFNRTTDDLPALDDEYMFLRDLYELMQKFNITLDDETRTRSFMLTNMMNALKNSLQRAEEQMQENQARFTQTLLRQVQAWAPKVQEVVTDVTSAITDDVHAHVHEVITYLETVSDTMTELKKDATQYDSQQGVLKVNFLDLDEMTAAAKTLEIKIKLWKGLASWEIAAEGWMDLPFTTLDIDATAKEIHEYWVKVMVCDKGLEKSAVVAHFMEKVQQFRLTLPVVTNLRCEALKQRHWDRIRSVLDIDTLSAESSVTLGDLINKDVKKSAGAVSTITTQAENEEILFRMVAKVGATPRTDASSLFHLGPPDPPPTPPPPPPAGPESVGLRRVRGLSLQGPQGRVHPHGG
jgi:dynein heavy chain